MNGKQLKNSILQWAIQGKLVPQDPNDEPASVLLEKIRAEKVRLVKEGKLKKKDLEVKPIAEDEIPFEIPQGWEWIRWGDLSESIQYGYNAPAKESGRIKMVRISDIQNGKIVWETTPYCNIEENEIGTYLLKKNDILFARTGGTVGKSYLVSEEPEEAIYAGYLIRTRYSGLLCAKYLKAFMESSLYWAQLKDGTIATAQPNCNGQTLSKMILPLPPLAEQHRIVAKIEELMPLVEKYGETQEALEEWNNSLPEKLKKSILQEAIQGKLVPQEPSDEPASVLLERIREEKKRLVKEGKLKKKDLEVKPIDEEEVPFEIPESWKWCHFGDVVDMQMGKTPPRGEALCWQNGTDSWVSISDMKDYGHIKVTKEQVSKYAVEHVFKNKSPEGTLLMSFKLTVGRTSILDIPAFHNEAIISIYPYIDSKNSFRDYLFYLLPVLSNLGDSKDAIKGKTLNSSSLNDLFIPLPPLAEQRRIVAKIEELFGVIKK